MHFEPNSNIPSRAPTDTDHVVPSRGARMRRPQRVIQIDAPSQAARVGTPHTITIRVRQGLKPLAEMAIQAALTGHLVFSTLHTNDAPAAITRLQDMGVEPYLVASVLEGVVAQRLVRRICAACRTHDEPSRADLDALGVDVGPSTPLYRGQGCDDCRGTGYRGRTGIYELFPITEDVRSLILRRASSREIRRQAIEAGMTTLRLDGWEKARDGVTTVEEILRVTQEDA